MTGIATGFGKQRHDFRIEVDFGCTGNAHEGNAHGNADEGTDPNSTGNSYETVHLDSASSRSATGVISLARFSKYR